MFKLQAKEHDFKIPMHKERIFTLNEKIDKDYANFYTSQISFKKKQF